MEGHPLRRFDEVILFIFDTDQAWWTAYLRGQYSLSTVRALLDELWASIPMSRREGVPTEFSASLLHLLHYTSQYRRLVQEMEISYFHSVVLSSAQGTSVPCSPGPRSLELLRDVFLSWAREWLDYPDPDNSDLAVCGGNLISDIGRAYADYFSARKR